MVLIELSGYDFFFLDHFAPLPPTFSKCLHCMQCSVPVLYVRGELSITLFRFLKHPFNMNCRLVKFKIFQNCVNLGMFYCKFWYHVTNVFEFHRIRVTHIHVFMILVGMKKTSAILTYVEPLALNIRQTCSIGFI